MRRRAIVGVILSRMDLRRAITSQTPPDLFELRLDALVQQVERIEAALGELGAPLIVTARHPREGGVNRLNATERRALLLRFLPYATFVDIEIRSAKAFGDILKEARKRGVKTIASFHDLRGTPSASRLDKTAAVARSLKSDILKVVTRTENVVQSARLRDFFRRHPGRRIAVMGVGRLGRRVRIELAEDGSALNYGHLGRRQIEGQLSVRELRRILMQKSGST